MAVTIQRVEYFNTTVRDRPGAAYDVLSHLAAADVNLLAFSAVPIGPEQTQLVLFPEKVDLLESAARVWRLDLTGPNRAFLIQGDDKLGALADIHRSLSEAQINVYASTGVTDGRGGFGYIVYVRPEDFERASRVLGV
jgi:predicted amino acid-binding ACT domain protein